MEVFHSFYFTLLISSLIFIVPKFSADPISDALLSLKSEFTDNSNSLNNWHLPPDIQSSTEIHSCSWTGVTCNEDSSKIIELDLSMKNLSGSLSGKQFNLLIDLINLNLSHNSFSNNLPSTIFNIKTLKSLDISKNNFSGEFPKGVSNLQNLTILDAFSNSLSGQLPVEISRIKSLKVLNFAGSYFNGTIPSEYGLFKNLEFIHLAGNSLSGEIPSELGNLKKLTHMEIGYNSYEGGIPWQFGNMSQLTYLDIADANLSGPMPSQLSNLTNLESLFLFRNQLNGKIPGDFSKMLSLKSLDLSDNLISGEIPDSFLELKNLRLLSLMYNEMSGSVPDSIAKLQELDTLLIWNNYFTGSLPEELGKYSKLQHVDVSTNYFVGNIPADICAGGQLQKLILFTNNFSGGVVPSISNCSSLVRIRLEDNSFSGEISLNFDNLSYVDFSRNMFIGEIPYDITRALRLEYFNLSNNLDIGGVIPIGIWSLPYLQNFSMSSCGLLGSIPQFDQCKSLSVLELSMNNLLGNIPESMYNCKEIVRIDLSFNNLTGPIPEKMGNGMSLGGFNVSYNDISGMIPHSFEIMDESSFFGNPNLCGVPLRPCHNRNRISNRVEFGMRKSRKLAWILTLCAVIVLLILTAVFGILHYNRKGQWKMVSFNGFPQFKPKDVLRSFTLPDSISKVVLPTGITVSVKKIEWEPKSMEIVLPVLIKIGNVRHKNLTRLLGICYNEEIAYLLYDYFSNGNLTEKIKVRNDWDTKFRVLIGIAKGLCFLHHDCFLAIPQGNLKASNVIFDENMEPCLAEYGLDPIVQMINSQHSGGFSTFTREEFYKDTYSFGELILEVVTNGRLTNTALNTLKISKEALISEVADENGIAAFSNLSELKSVIEVAFLCMKRRASERPLMRDVLKKLSILKSPVSGKPFGPKEGDRV